MSGRDDVLVGDKYPTALVLREEAQPGGLPDQDLPWPLPEGRSFPADDPPILQQRPDPALCNHHTNHSLPSS